MERNFLFHPGPAAGNPEEEVLKGETTAGIGNPFRAGGQEFFQAAINSGRDEDCPPVVQFACFLVLTPDFRPAKIPAYRHIGPEEGRNASRQTVRHLCPHKYRAVISPAA
jgi:hypothetical protein